MSGISWWRSWHGAPTDHKWAVVAARSGAKVGVVSAIAWALLDYASQHQERGSVAGFDPEEYSVFSGFPQKEIEAVIQAMTDKGIISNGRLTNWEKRQPKREDDSYERVARHREMKRNVTQCNAPDKDTDKDKETEPEAEQTATTAAAPSPVDYDFGSLCNVYQKDIGPLTPGLSETLQADLDDYGLQNCMDAITEALRNNVRKWAYVQSVLRRWKTEGREKPKPNTPPPPKMRTLVDAYGNTIQVPI